MTRNGQRVVKESFFNQICLLLVIIVDLGELLVVQWDVVTFNEVVVEVDGEDLGVLHGLVGVFRQVLVVDVVGRLLCFPVAVLGFGWV